MISNNGAGQWNYYYWASSWTAAATVASSESGQYLFLGGSDYSNLGTGRFMVSSNYGSSWTQPATAPIQPWKFIRASSGGSFVYALSNAQSYISTDFGSSWTRSSFGNVNTICDSKNFEVLFAINDQLVLTYNKGQSWQYIDLPFVPVPDNLFLFDCSETGQYLVATSSRFDIYIYH